MKKKLAIINSSSLETSYGGVGPFIKNLDPFLRDTFDVTYFHLPEELHDSKWPRRLVFLVYLWKKRDELNKFDMILSHVPEGSLVATYTNTPLAHIFHGNFNPMSQSRYWYGRYFKWIFDIFESRIIRRAALKYTVGKERPGIPKIFNPILHGVKDKPTGDRHGFIFTGRLEKIKNIDRIIQIYAQVPENIRKDHPLYIAGEGSQEKILKDLVASLSLGQQVHFLGNLPNEQLVEAVSNKKIHVMASSQEGLPMALAEALSVGLPAISTDTGDISRVLVSGKNGFLMPLDFKDADYVKSIETILSDYETYSKNAKESAEIFRAQEVARSLSNDILRYLDSHARTDHP